MNMNRRTFLRSTALGVVGLAASRRSEAAEARIDSRPNILYIFADDLSRRAVGCYPEAHDWVKTPNIDRLAKEGVRFATCYTGAWRQPARATALSGRLQHGIEWLRAGRKPGNNSGKQRCPFWPAAFRKGGISHGHDRQVAYRQE
jgi:arylsulfatase A-like enzyme